MEEISGNGIRYCFDYDKNILSIFRRILNEMRTFNTNRQTVSFYILFLNYRVVINNSNFLVYIPSSKEIS